MRHAHVSASRILPLAEICDVVNVLLLTRARFLAQCYFKSTVEGFVWHGVTVVRSRVRGARHYPMDDLTDSLLRPEPPGDPPHVVCGAVALLRPHEEGEALSGRNGGVSLARSCKPLIFWRSRQDSNL